MQAMLWLFFAVSVPLVLLAVAWGLALMPQKGTSWTVRFDVGLAWLAALSILVLVPTDVAASLQGRQPQVLSLWWRVAYWYGFLAQFTLLPFHQEYADSGHFTWADRASASLRNNLIFYAVLAGVGAAGLLLLLLTGQLEVKNVVGFCIAFSNAFGLIAGIFLMGYGLVAIPRLLWQSADIRGQQRILYARAGQQAEAAMNAHSELAKARAVAAKVSVMFSRRDPLRKYIDVISDMSTDFGAAAGLGEPSGQLTDEEVPDIYDRQDMGALRRRIRKAGETYLRERELYLSLVHQFLEVEDVMQNAKQPWSQPFTSTMHGEVPRWAAFAERWWKCLLRGWCFRLLAVLCALLSLAVVVAEATISEALPNLSVFSWALHRVADNEILTELLTFTFLAYPCVCAYYALYRLGRFSFYLLVPAHTPAYSLLANAMLMCRFGPPLAFNFMAALAMPPSKHDALHDVTDTVFYNEFGRLMMHQPVIGSDFTTYAPIFLVPYVVLLTCNIFNRTAAFFTRGHSLEFSDDGDPRSPQAIAGLRLLQTELQNRNNGRPLGLTLSPRGEAGADEEAGRSRWWPFRKRERLLSNDRLREAQGSSSERAAGREAERAPTVPDPPRDPPRGPVGALRGWLGQRGPETSQASESQRLMSGPSSSGGDLDSIFDRLNAGQAQPPQRDASLAPAKGVGPRQTTLSVESDSEEPPPSRRWFRR